MATKKVIEVNETSIIDLKAELFRKEQQFRKESGTPKPKTDNNKKPPVWSKQTKNAKSGHKTQTLQDNDGPSEDEKALHKSRKILESKAALYEKMAKGEIEENEEDIDNGEEGRFLVDFHKKIYSSVKDNESDNEQNEDIGPPTPPPSCPKDEWVDYVDSLGRSRRCLRKDLKGFQERDQELTPRKSPSPPTLLSDDMRREIMRKKWEQEEEEAMNNPVGPIHYQNIQFDEVRNHGVGYYQFSKNQEEREQQMQMLTKLREETLDQRSRIDKIKDKRKAALEARLAKVRARKAPKNNNEDDMQRAENVLWKEDISTDENEEDTKTDENQSESTQHNDKVNPVESDEETEMKQAKKTKLPEWARHKINQPDISKSYLNQRREEREHEFAPPSFYNDTATNVTRNTSKNVQKKRYWRDIDDSEQTAKLDEASSTKYRTEQDSTPEIQNQVNAPENQPWLPPYPPYPPHVGYFMPPFQIAAQQGGNYPTLPPPPQEYFQSLNYPPPFSPLQYAMPPPCQPFPWQQGISHQTAPTAFQNGVNGPSSLSTESALRNSINPGNNENQCPQDGTTNSLPVTSISGTSIIDGPVTSNRLLVTPISDGPVTVPTVDSLVADFVSSIRNES